MEKGQRNEDEGKNKIKFQTRRMESPFQESAWSASEKYFHFLQPPRALNIQTPRERA
jgi:hypothetical protein